MRRPEDATFRRGLPVGEGGDEGARSAYRPYRPEPEDELLHPGTGADESSAGAHVDNTPPGFDDRPPPPVVLPPVVAAPVVLPPPLVVPPSVARVLPDEPAAPEPQAANPPAAYAQFAGPEQPYDDLDAHDYRYAPSRDDRDRPSGGVSALAIGGFVLLGILAIGVGAFISGVFSGQVAQGTPSPTPTVSAAPSGTPQTTTTPIPSASVGASPNASEGPPFSFPDGFSARTEPCVDEPASPEGCASSGASVSGGSVWVWVGFRTGNNTDLLGVTIVDAAGASVGTGGPLALSSIGCGDSCSGWARFRFSGLGPGSYTILVDRNGRPAAEATFTVTG